LYAIIKSGGKQYKAEEGQVLRLEKLDAEQGARVELNDVLLVKTDEKIYTGNPFVSGASVEGVVVRSGKDDKVIVFKFKRRKQYKRKRGHRQSFSDVRIEKISFSA
jgi:large subunit ribosomal protein L21